MPELFACKLIYRSSTGAVRGSAVARNVRATKTLFVVSPENVEVTDGGVTFGGERRYDRRTLSRVPRSNPHSGNGQWCIDRESIKPMP